MTNSLATQSGILQNTATKSKFYNIYLHTWPVLYYSSIIFSFFLDSWTTSYMYIYIYKQDVYQYKRQFNEAKKRGNQQNCQTTEDKHAFSNYAITLSMESPFETLEWHDDHVHSDETSREKLVLPKQTQNWGPLLKSALWD